MEYASAVDVQLAETVPTVVAFLQAWIAEKRKFRDLATAVFSLSETIER